MGIRRNYSEGNYSQKLIEMSVSHRFAPTVTHTHNYNIKFNKII